VKRTSLSFVVVGSICGSFLVNAGPLAADSWYRTRYGDIRRGHLLRRMVRWFL